MRLSAGLLEEGSLLQYNYALCILSSVEKKSGERNGRRRPQDCRVYKRESISSKQCYIVRAFLPSENNQGKVKRWANRLVLILMVSVNERSDKTPASPTVPCSHRKFFENFAES